MKIKKYFILLLFSGMILGIINNIISFITYPLYADLNSQTHSLYFYIIMNFILAFFFGSFIIAIYILIRNKMPGKGILKGIFYGVFIIWLFGPVFPFAYELAFKLSVSKQTIIFLVSSFITWIIYGIILELFYSKVIIEK